MRSRILFVDHGSTNPPVISHVPFDALHLGGTGAGVGSHRCSVPANFHIKGGVLQDRPLVRPNESGLLLDRIRARRDLELGQEVRRIANHLSLSVPRNLIACALAITGRERV